MNNAEYKIKPLEKSLINPCYIPLTLFLRLPRRRIMCPHDWGKKAILGNFNNESLKEIWFSKKECGIDKC